MLEQLSDRKKVQLTRVGSLLLAFQWA